MRRLLQISLATIIVTATLFVFAPQKSEARRWVAYYGYYPAPVVVHSYRPVYYPHRYVYRPYRVHAYYAPPVVSHYYGGPYCWW